jgi:hypothetical protein
MRTIADMLTALLLRRFWRRRLADEYAVLIAGIGLERAEEEALLSLRRRR